MLKLKRAACAALSALLLVSTTALSGCSTPKVAMTVDGQEIETGLYLAYLYNTFYQLYYGQGMYQYAAYMDVWAQEFTYGEGDNAEKLKLAEYIKRQTQDSIVRQIVLKKMIGEYSAKTRDEDIKELEEQLKSVRNYDVNQFGFNKAHYEELLRAVSTYEKQLFYHLYGKGGPREMSEEDIQKYFDNNFLSYKIIEISLTDSSGTDLSEEKANEVKERLNDYLDLYRNNKDFDKVIEKYQEDEKAASTTTGTGTGSTGTTTTTTAGDTTTAPADPTGTTTAAGTTTGTAGNTTAPTGTGTTGGTQATGSGSSDKEEENKDPNRRDIDANVYGDEDFTNAVKTVEIGEAKVVTYKKGGTKNTAALILRMDPRVKEGVEDVVEENRESIISGANFDDYNEEITKAMKELEVVVDKSAIKACDPKKFVAS